MFRDLLSEVPVQDYGSVKFYRKSIRNVENGENTGYGEFLRRMEV